MTVMKIFGLAVCTIGILQDQIKCLAAFATQYTTCSGDNKNAIHLKKKDLRCVIKRRKDAVMKAHRFADDDYRYYYSKLLLFLPW